MQLRDRVGLNIQELRRARKLSQEELAYRAKIHQTYLSGVEGGKRNPSLLVLDRIAKALSADIEELVRRRRRTPNRPTT
jgi:transcriptional regulator with XRE-family HTH domain